MVPFLLRRPRPTAVTRLSDDLDRVLEAIGPDRSVDKAHRLEPLTTAVAALNSLMCKGPDQRFAGIAYDELRAVVADYLERSAFEILVTRLAELPITLSLVTAAAKDCQLTEAGADAETLESIRSRATQIIQRLNRCVLA